MNFGYTLTSSYGTFAPHNVCFEDKCMISYSIDPLLVLILELKLPIIMPMRDYTLAVIHQNSLCV